MIAVVEEIAGLLLNELNKQGIVCGRQPFLESYVGQIAERAGKMSLSISNPGKEEG